MNQFAIHTDNLSKLYRIGERHTQYRTIRDSVAQFFKAGFRRVFSHPLTNFLGEDYIWALRNISLDIEHGEIVGIIGRNGSGKSTLLKVLSRITDPTEGYGEVHGRTASLVDIGTGFHLELTGRENIFLNGAILGMRKIEIERRFDEIVSFAEVEKFLDTPLKHYSTGMAVRLGFAVAAHLDPDILLVDEVLAVGDAAFQEKCVGKMGEVAKRGRTVLFVSHNLAPILSLCERVFWLDSGKLVEQGPTEKIVQDYLQSTVAKVQIPIDQREERSGDGSVRIVSLKVESLEGGGVITSSSRLKITVGYRSTTAVRYPRFIATISDYTTGTGILQLDSDAVGGLPETLPSEGSITCLTDAINLTPGRCLVDIALEKGGVMADYLPYATSFDVDPDDMYRSGKMPSRDRVICVGKHRWFPASSG